MDGFRIHTVAAEGFKGFTNRQEFSIGGRHLFVFGPNAHGKSSLIEAIRWGLFGSTRRQGEAVANTRYTGSCRVEIGLVRSGDQLHLRRVLSKGAGGRTDAEVIDKSGTTRSIKQVLPQLDSASAGEHVHAIYSQQSGTNRRAPEDLEPFERTVYSHLGLTDAKALQTQLESFLQEQEALEKRLGEEIDKARSGVDQEIQDLRARQGRILDLSPWGEGRAPTVSETEFRIRDFISRIDSTESPSSGASADALLDLARQALNKLEHSTVTEYQTEIDSLAARNHELTNISSKLDGIHMEKQTLVSAINESTIDIETKLGSFTIQEITQQKNDVLATIEYQELLMSLTEQGAEIVGRMNDQQMACPLCDAQHERDELLSLIHARLSGDSHQLRRECYEELQKLTDEVHSLQRIVDDSRLTLDSLKLEHQEALGRTRKLIDIDGHSIDKNAIAVEINRNRRLIEQREHLRDEGDSLIKREALALANVEDESKLHVIQKRMRELQEIGEAAQEAQRTLDTLVAFGETVRGIHEAMNETLVSWLRDQLPGVTEPMSEAFTALTRHPVYDRLAIPHTDLPRLRLRVSSAEDPNELSNPEDVLNGQALSALELVPYFALGQLREAPVEVFTLLLDDPTQAFDPGHIELLIQRLSVLADSTQLIVASHETERFENLVEMHFPADSYCILKVEDFSRINGPGFVVVNA